MHAMNMWLTDASSGVLEFAPMASQHCWGVSLRARRDTTQVMLGGGVTAGHVRHNSS